MKSLKIFTISTLVLFSIASLNSQPLPAKTYGGTDSERAFALEQAMDNGFVLAGWTRSFGPGTPGFSNVLIVKTDSAGTPLWAKISIGQYDDEAYSITQTFDGGFAITGWTYSYGINAPQFSNIFVLKIDPLGNLQWSRVYGGFSDDQAYSIIQTMDGGYAITGWTNSFGPPPYPNILVMKLDPLGFPQWARAYWTLPNLEEEGYDITEVIPPDTFQYIVAGRARISDPTNFDAFDLILDQYGNPLLVTVVPGENEDEAYSVIWDGTGFVTAGWTNSFGPGAPNFSNIFIWKGMPGGFLWGWVYGWANDDEKCLDDQSLMMTMDGGYAISGWTKSFGPGIPNPNFLILKLTPGMGLFQWARVHPSAPGAQFEEAYPMIHTYFGGYGIAGWTNSFGLGLDDFHFLTLDPSGNRPVCVLEAELPSDSLFAYPWHMEFEDFRPELDSMPLVDTIVEETDICPVVDIKNKPSKKQFKTGTEIRVKGNLVELTLANNSEISLQVFDISGRYIRTLAKGIFGSGTHRFILPQDIEAGVYFINLQIEGTRSLTTKFIKL
ncbi:MAG: T9SS type A sorting domain-containing protein [candidate division WOR-3 bacterium]|nr:T9SS type A sorting domain-containing protein [candidate division WOR-3 bacterium]MDH5683959.1 T9SS type A sorting domain-containing protein [candidate division WOR-3 bacterium]